MEILRELRKNWASIVNVTLARHSYPCILGVNTISVAVEDQKAANTITKMKGNIRRALISKFNYNVDENFTMKIIMGHPKKEKKLKAKRPKVDIEVDEELVKFYMQEAPATLPEDINYAISHLQAFFDVLFPE